MKKTLLFAMLALSINAFTQSKRPISYQQHPTFNPAENIQGCMQDSKTKMSGMFHENLMGQINKHPMLKPDSLVQIVDSIYNWQWDTVSNGWEIKSKTLYLAFNANNICTSYLVRNWNGITWVNSSQVTNVLGANNKLISTATKTWDGNAWINSSKDTLTYDANNNLTSDISKNWDGNAWVNNIQTISTYDANNNKTSNLFQMNWDGSTWAYSSKDTSTYDANNNLLSVINKSVPWDGSGGMVNYSQVTYSYDVNNNQIQEIRQNWNVSEWENSRRYDKTYGANHNLISELDWHWINNDWMKDRIYNVTYNENNNMTSILEKSWEGTFWQNSSKDTITYNVNNKQTSRITKYWDVSASAWVAYYKVTTTYDVANHYTGEIYQQWNGINWIYYLINTANYDAYNFLISYSSKGWFGYNTVQGSDSAYYYYHTLLTGIKVVDKSEISVYPNPTNGKFTVSGNSSASAIEIYNLSGACVYSDFKSKKQTSNEVDLSGSAKGIYLVKMYDGKRMYSRKVVVQ